MNKEKEFQDKFCVSNLYDAYTHPLPCLYWSQLMKGVDVMQKDVTSKYIFDKDVKQFCDNFSKQNPNKKLIFVDMLSAYGNVILSTVFGLKPEACLDLIDTEEKAEVIGQKIQRLWSQSEIWGFDISENALKYCEKQKIFDKSLAFDINKLLTLENESKICKEVISQCHVIFLCSILYIDEEIMYSMIDWFASGKEEGYFIITITFPIDVVDRSTRIKKYLISKLEFVNSAPGKHRFFLNEEEGSRYSETMSYNETWCFKRKI